MIIVHPLHIPVIISVTENLGNINLIMNYTRLIWLKTGKQFRYINLVITCNMEFVGTIDLIYTRPQLLLSVHIIENLWAKISLPNTLIQRTPLTGIYYTHRSGNFEIW